jgi:hypothetical protein
MFLEKKKHLLPLLGSESQLLTFQVQMNAMDVKFSNKAHQKIKHKEALWYSSKEANYFYYKHAMQ